MANGLFGAGKGVDCMLCFAIGTGIGGGVVMNNQLILNQGGTAGELGHITIDIHGPICGCGNHGCVETLASGPAIAAMGLKAVVQGQKTIIGEMVNYDLNKVTAHVIAKAAEAGDEIALSIWNEVALILAWRLSMRPWWWAQNGWSLPAAWLLLGSCCYIPSEKHCGSA